MSAKAVGCKVPHSQKSGSKLSVVIFQAVRFQTVRPEFPYHQVAGSTWSDIRILTIRYKIPDSQARVSIPPGSRFHMVRYKIPLSVR